MDKGMIQALQNIKGNGEQVWIARVSPSCQGTHERWVASPISQPFSNQSFSKGLAGAMRAILAETDEAEVWDCYEERDNEEVAWKCILRKSGTFSGPNGRVSEGVQSSPGAEST